MFKEAEKLFELYGVEKTDLLNVSDNHKKELIEIAEAFTRVSEYFLDAAIKDKFSLWTSFNLVLQEFGEVAQAIAVFAESKNIEHEAELLKEVSDLIATVLGFGLLFFNSDELRKGYLETYKNNLTKVFPDGKVHKCQGGRVLKPEGFKKLGIEDLINCLNGKNK